MEYKMTYIAKQMVGEFKAGDEVTGLPAKRLKELVEDGAIEEVADKSKQTTKRTTKTSKED